MAGLKPFTVSLLEGKRKELSGRMVLDHKSFYRIRITLLEEELFEVCSSALFSLFSLDKKVVFYDKEFLINKICISPEDHPFARVEHYRDLKKYEKGKTFLLNFRSPTGFVYGDGIMPLPLPYSIFRSYLLKWNSFSPPEYKIPEDFLGVVERCIFPSKYSLNTKLLDMEKYKMVGFIGRCCFNIIGKVSKEDLSRILTLVRFSFYGGTGAKTTVGMGQTLPEF